MLIPNVNKLSNLVIDKIILPTFDKVTKDQEIVIEMIDGTLGVYDNTDGFVTLYGKFKNWKHFCKDTGLTMGEMHPYDNVLTLSLKKYYPNILKVYSANI